MDIIRAIKHLGIRFNSAVKEKNRNLYINQNDIDALNKIAEFIELMQKQQFEANQLFAKLYIFVYMRFISKMEATVMDSEPRKALHKILQKPIEYWIEEFKNEMNDSEIYASLKEIGIEAKHPLMLNDDEINQRNSIVSAEKDSVLKALENVWDFETTKECLVIEINNAINKYRI